MTTASKMCGGEKVCDTVTGDTAAAMPATHSETASMRIRLATLAHRRSR